jgi:N-acetylglutamate synthase-like GNAT family acetyltransferase
MTQGLGHGFELRWLAPTDPLMHQVDDLRFEVLFGPFGVRRNDMWNDAHPDVHRLAAVENGLVIGYSCLLVDGREGQVRQVSVAFQRQRSGVGRALMLETERHARTLGLRRLYLNARLKAEPFYHRIGWTTLPGNPFPSGRTNLLHVAMEKRLDR